MSYKGNIGEWSELYVFLKLLSDGKLFAGDENLKKIEKLYYPIISIIKIIDENKISYNRNSVIKIKKGEDTVLNVPIAEFCKAAEIVLESIRSKSGSSFAIKEIQEFLDKILIKSVKASSTDKRDITIIVHDLKTQRTQELGFSIKSMLGGASTLLNPGKSTNFIFRLSKEISEKELKEINSINSRNKLQDRIAAIYINSVKLIFFGLENRNFANNLRLTDSKMPEMLAYMMLYFYQENISLISELIEKLETENPLNFDQSSGHKYYEYKIKKLLVEIALGFTPSHPWNGYYDATGGYIIVKEDGEIICYHIYNRNEFEEYLINNTRLDKASSTRYEYAKIYEENNINYIKLNLQIRFIR